MAGPLRGRKSINLSDLREARKKSEAKSVVHSSSGTSRMKVTKLPQAPPAEATPTLDDLPPPDSDYNNKDTEWQIDRFKTVSLQSLGQRVQLGHLPRQYCPFPKAAHKDFVVLAMNGIHVLTVDFCGCIGSPEWRNQLLEVGWFPSSYKEPRTVATFELLWTFHLINLQGQLPMTDFYRALEQLTDGAGLENIPDRYAQLAIMIRKWRHLKSVKRCGCAHDLSGIDGTPQGGTMVLCRSCPYPEINIPADWYKTPPEKKFLYNLILSVDANFKQKARV
ncbi:hypothetical protein V5O48_017382 [Marasmius crinis-equi]|uniref:CxC2-like cysteine cluster KDZ transposase-associated domain-containing protein n=1 Tax=Marasmius crinis-equi TaxID=585013 RepID=A0ABR3EP58_9AGAR